MELFHILIIAFPQHFGPIFDFSISYNYFVHLFMVERGAIIPLNAYYFILGLIKYSIIYTNE